MVGSRELTEKQQKFSRKAERMTTASNSKAGRDKERKTDRHEAATYKITNE
jgi:hypothetical protein